MRKLELRRVAALALVVLPAAFALLWLVGRTLDRNRAEAANSQLVADLQVARATLQSDVAVAARKASLLAHMPRVQRALARDDGATLQELTARHPDTVLISRHVRRGSLAPLGIRRTVDVVEGGRRIGRVVTDAPLDAAYLARVQASLPVGADDLVVITRRGKIVRGALPAGTSLSAATPRQLHVAGRGYRALGSQLVSDRPELQIVALTRGETSFVSAWRLPLAVFATILALSVVALLPFGGLWQERRQPPPRVSVEPRIEPEPHVQPAPMNVAALGEMLAATNDVDSLLRVILDAAIKATGAVGGRVARPGDVVPRVGGSGSEMLRVPLATNEPDGELALLLYPPPSGFSAEAAGVAHWLGEHASTAIRSARMHRVAQEDATADELTGLANRRQFTTVLQAEFARAEGAAVPLSLVLGDLDDFKSLNDRFGIRAGDDVLRAFAGVLRRNTRDVDLSARIGGEEFGVLLLETDAEGARQFAERLRAELRVAEGLPTPVTASFGVSSYPSARTAEELLATANTNLRRAKEGGKDRVVAVDGSANEPARA